MRVGDQLLDDRLEAAILRASPGGDRLVDRRGRDGLLAERQRELLALERLDEERRLEPAVADRLLALGSHGVGRGHARLRGGLGQQVLAAQEEDRLRGVRERHVCELVHLVPAAQDGVDVLVPLEE